MRRISIPIPDGEVDYWIRNAAKNFGITEGQFLMICVANAWKHLYGKTITWREFTLIETKKLEKLESLALGTCVLNEHIPGECGIHCEKRDSAG